MKRGLVLTLVMIGCNGGDGGDDDKNYSPLTPSGVERPMGDPLETYESSLDSGSVIDLAFAESLFCFPANENENFDGSHVFFEHTQDIGTHVTIIATPETGLDISLYVIQTPPGGSDLPPDFVGGAGTSCEAEFDQAEDSNAGTPEGLTMGGWDQSYRLIIGVAGAHGVTSGDFKVDIWESTAE